jgi:hypothetical protein
MGCLLDWTGEAVGAFTTDAALRHPRGGVVGDAAAWASLRAVASIGSHVASIVPPLASILAQVTKVPAPVSAVGPEVLPVTANGLALGLRPGGVALAKIATKLAAVLS